MNENPYQAPQSFEVPQAQLTDAEAVRQEHIKTEASIKSIGILYWLASIALAFVSISMIAAASTNDSAAGVQIAAAAGLLALAILQFVVGLEIRKLKQWARVAVAVLSGIGLLGFPVGTLVNAYILFLIFGKKGQMVFSPGYKDVIAATPQVKYKSSKWIWFVLLGIIAVILLLAFFAPRAR